MKPNGILFVYVFFTVVIGCGNGAADINAITLQEAKAKGYIHELYMLSEGLQGAKLEGETTDLGPENDGRLGFYDASGKVVIPFEYYWASDEDQIIFSNGLAPAADKKRKAGYINKKGEWMIKPQWDYARSFYEGIAYVRGGFNGEKKAAYIKMDGSYFIQPKFSLIYYFPPDYIYIFVDQNDKWGLSKPDGRIIDEPIYDRAISVFEGRALFVKNHKYGFIDLSGNKITESEYDFARNFINGTAIVAKEKNGFDYSYYGIIDRNGKYLIPLRSDIVIEINETYNDLKQFQDYADFPPWAANPVVDGVFSARLKEKELYGLMNLKGEWVTEPIYSSLHFIGNKRFRFVTQDKKTGVMGTDGKIIN